MALNLQALKEKNAVASVRGSVHALFQELRSLDDFMQAGITEKGGMVLSETQKEGVLFEIDSLMEKLNGNLAHFKEVLKG